MWICERCKATLEDEDIIEIDNGYYDSPESECPECGGDYFSEAEQCEVCGEWHTADQLTAGVCEDCGAQIVRAFHTILLSNFKQVERDFLSAALDGQSLTA